VAEQAHHCGAYAAGCGRYRPDAGPVTAERLLRVAWRGAALARAGARWWGNSAPSRLGPHRAGSSPAGANRSNGGRRAAPPSRPLRAPSKPRPGGGGGAPGDAEADCGRCCSEPLHEREGTQVIVACALVTAVPEAVRSTKRCAMKLRRRAGGSKRHARDVGGRTFVRQRRLRSLLGRHRVLTAALP
jgi:hypothetical protein